MALEGDGPLWGGLSTVFVAGVRDPNILAQVAALLDFKHVVLLMRLPQFPLHQAVWRGFYLE